jgi:outer membrane biosynthesis protein TonB
MAKDEKIREDTHHKRFFRVHLQQRRTHLAAAIPGLATSYLQRNLQEPPMPILQLPPNPARNTDEDSPDSQSLKVRTARFGQLEEHELIHLIDALDDERSRARFRESIYISILVWIVIGWFLFYGPRILFHQPVLRDPIALMKQHDKERLTYLNQPPAPPRRPPVLNQKIIQQIQKQMQAVPKPQPAPQPPAPQQQAPPPQEQAHTTAPPVPRPAIPLPSAPRPSPSVDLPSAPQPKIASNSQSAHNALQDAMRGALTGRSGADVGGSGRAAGPLQAGAQILSDTGDWDYTEYMRKLHNDIQRNWDPLIPEEVEPPLMKKGIVGIRFIILRDGQIGDIKLETTSGDVALDKAAWYAITSEGQFPQLPKEYHGQQLELRIGFFYNTPLHQ